MIFTMSVGVALPNSASWLRVSLHVFLITSDNFRTDFLARLGFSPLPVPTTTATVTVATRIKETPFIIRFFFHFSPKMMDEREKEKEKEKEMETLFTTEANPLFGFTENNCNGL